MGALKRFNECLVKMGSWGTILFMAVMAVVIPYEVIGRYVFEPNAERDGSSDENIFRSTARVLYKF